MKLFIKSLIPPILHGFISNFKYRNYGWSGSYKAWEDAAKDAIGYNSQKIFDKVSDAILLVKRGEKAYERDSVLFDKVHYSWPLLSALMWIAANNKGKLNLIDFGGSLGSTYFQNQRFLNDLDVQWNIVEQAQFVQFGNQQVANDRLKFFHSIKDCVTEKKTDAILLSSVLPYIEKPYKLIESIVNTGFEWVLIDRTPIIEQKKDRLTVQTVPPEIYEASYPCWIFSYNNFLKCFSKYYTLIEEFDAIAGKVFIRNPSSYYFDKGFIFRRRKRTFHSKIPINNC